MDAGTGILPGVRNATGGVFHAERAWAADATSVTIGGVELNSSTPYYVNGVATNDATQNWTAKFENGTLTLRGLNLTVQASEQTQGIDATTGDLTINLIGKNSITQNGTHNAIRAWFGLTISGTGTLTVRDSAHSSSSLIYANGKIEIKEGAVIDAAKTGGSAQTINAHGGNLTVTGSNTSVKAVTHGSDENSDAIRVDLSSGTGNATVTVKGSAVLEAETKSSSAKAINGTVVATDYAGKIKAGESKAMAIAWTDSSAVALNTYKYVRIGEEEPNYLTFTAQEAKSTISLKWKSADQNSVYISKNDGTTWDSYTAGKTITLTNVGDKVSFKGKNVTTDFSNHFTMSGKIAASGSVTSLTDGKGNDSNVQLQKECYKYMFYNCTVLTAAPELPATNLKDNCYNYMFCNCTSLTTAPKLPAISLVEYCYEGMFSGCVGLTTAPVLLAQAVPNAAYQKMFESCTSLTAAPALLAETIGGGSYGNMFAGCTSLTTPPSTLPAKSLASGCYSGMFSGCTSLKTVPTILAVNLADRCFSSMFRGCKNLSIKEKSDATHKAEWKFPVTQEPNTTLVEWDREMFDDLDSLAFPSKTSTGNRQYKAPKLNTTYYVNPNGANSGGTSHTHQWSYTWASDGTHHWHECTVAGCDVTDNANKGGYATHNASNTVWKYDTSKHWRICKDCGAEITSTKEAHSSTGNNTSTCQKAATCDICGRTYGEKAAHVADTNKWVYDAAHHWRVCQNCKAVMDDTKATHAFENGKCKVCDYKEGPTVNPAPNPTPSGSSGGGYVAPSTDVKTSGSADSKVTSSPSTVQNETRTDASGKQETVAKVTVSAANQREILSQAKANKSKRIIIQIAKTAVQGDAKLELNLDKTFVQSILHDTEASLTIRTADGDKVIAREALKTLVAQTEGNTVVIDPAAQENPTDPAEPSKAETLAALDSSRLVARSKLVTLKNGRKGIRITWSDKNGAEMNFDGVEIYRSTKKNRFGKKPFYATKGGKSAGYYINSKSLKSGVTYYYKVRGYVLIDGQKHYTDLSLKAIRTVK